MRSGPASEHGGAVQRIDEDHELRAGHEVHVRTLLATEADREAGLGEYDVVVS
jgi:hypothetical protein